MVEARKRNSSIELLRILCIFGIIFMHTIAYGGDKLATYNRLLLIAVNCITNLGVTCFMLISGYFGVSFSLKKLIRLDLMVIFYSVAHLAIRFALGVDTGKTDILSAVFPILSNLYWYITVYVILVILSPFLNRIPEKLSRDAFLRLIAILLFFSSVVPTLLSFDLLGREGKNVVHMAAIYLIGRYIRQYDNRLYAKGRLLLLLAGNIGVTMLLELGLFFLTGRYSLFYRDCSLFTVCSSILLFTVFRSLHFESRIVNKIATTVLAVYVFSYGFQRLVYELIPLKKYAFSPLLFPLICIFAPCVVVGCILIELLRQKLFGGVEGRLVESLETMLRNLHGQLCRLGHAVTGKVTEFIAKK